jgi:gliding motility-associated-like protein
MHSAHTVFPESRFFFIKRAALLIALFIAGPRLAIAQPVPCPPNIDFEFGSFTNWNLHTGNCCPIVLTTPPSGPVTGRHQITAGAGLDPIGGFPIVAPGGGAYSLKLGNTSINAEAEGARYYVHVPVGFNSYTFNYKYCFVLQDPQHNVADQPRFTIKAYDSATLAPIPCADQTFVSGTPIPGIVVVNDVNYLPWTNGSLNLAGQSGKTIIVEFASGDCALGGHWGYGYVDVISCGTFVTTITACDLSGQGVTLTGPSGYQTYTWYDQNFTPPGLGGGQVITVPAPATPQYYNLVLVPYIGVGCPDTLQTIVVANVTVNASPDTLCNPAGQPIQLDANGGGGVGTLTYQWSGSPGLSCTNCENPIATPVGSSRYYVTVTDTNGCFRKDTLTILESVYLPDAGTNFTTCVGTPVQLNGTVTPLSPFYTYNWSPSADLSSGTIPNPMYNPTTPGVQTFVFTVDSSYCTKSDSIVITTLPNDFIIHDTTICKGAVIQVYAVGHPAFTYSWSPVIGLSSSNVLNPIVTADTPRTYTVTAKYPTCPDIVKTFTIDVQPTPTVNLGPDTAKCQWENLFIYADVNPKWYSQYTYTWNPNSTINNTNTPNVIFSGMKDTFLVLNVKTPIGCTGKDTINITVHQGNFASLSPVDTAICPNNTVQMNIQGGAEYDWQPDIYLTDNSIANPVVSPITDVDYTITVTDKFGCEDTLKSHITVHPQAVLELGDSVFLYPGERFQMNPTTNALYFNWFPPLGLSATNIANPVVMPPVNTRYFVQATTEAGCVVKDSIDVIVNTETLLNVPNAFSPGSAPNDVLKINKKGEATLKSFAIYNRWGNKVFETSNIEQGWDGTINGKTQPMGVYVYMIDAVTKTGKRFNKQGNVTLIR